MMDARVKPAHDEDYFVTVPALRSSVKNAAPRPGHEETRYRGARTITTWRPSKRASCSTLANSATSAFTLSRSLVPIS
jgi:hypothetical protein